MSEAKTKQTEESVTFFVDRASEEVRKDCYALIRLMEKVTGLPPKMWGPAIIGFGSYHYKYDSGHEGDSCIIGFSPRKNNLSLYVLTGFPEQDELLKKMGKHKTGKGCLYIKKLEEVDMVVLESLINRSFIYLKKKYESI